MFHLVKQILSQEHHLDFFFSPNWSRAFISAVGTTCVDSAISRQSGFHGKVCCIILRGFSAYCTWTGGCSTGGAQQLVG